MTDFHPSSIDWDSVRLLHGEHLRGETAYLEGLVRWVLAHAAGPGVVHMQPDSLALVASSPSTYRLALRRFQALTPAGYWVCIGDDEFSPRPDRAGFADHLGKQNLAFAGYFDGFHGSTPSH